MSWRSRSCKWKGLTDYWNLIYEFLQWCFITIAWVKIGVLQTVIFKEIWRKPATNVDFFLSLWQMKYIHNAYSLSKNGIWNGLDLISLKQYIKLNMVLGLKFLRLYIFFFYRDEYCTYSSETVPMESWKVLYEAVNTTHL